MSHEGDQDQPARRDLYNRAAALLDELDVETDERSPEEPGQGEESGEPGLYFASLHEFVSWLLEVYRRPMDGPGATWCPDWWKHPEAIVRLDALWRAWEKVRQDPATGVSVWLKDHCDHHMAVLLDPNGPLHGCKPERHSPRPLQALPAGEPPASPLTGEQSS